MNQETKHMLAALRQAQVWAAHRDKLARFASTPANADRLNYATVNRQTLTKAIRALVADMDDAQEGKDG